MAKSKVRKGQFIVTQARNGEPLRMSNGTLVPLGNNAQTSKATVFADTETAALAARTFTHKGTQGRPPKVVIVQIGEEFSGEIAVQQTAEVPAEEPGESAAE